MSVAYQTPAVDDAVALEHRPSEPPMLPPRRPRRGRRAWLAAIGLSAVVVLGVAAESVPPGTPGHQAWTTITSGTSVAAAAPGVAQVPSAGAPPAAADPQVAAIQQVIQQANAEQVQAIAQNNLSVMSDTATAAHYQEMSQINQQLQAQGVTAIQLTNLSWGPITVNGNTATATSYETWASTLSDGTTMQSTDQNVYTLVLQNGSWLISQTTTPSSAVNPDNTSRNWSGYLATGKSYTAVTGTWTVPQPSASGSTGVGATWVGIGGVSSRDLIQAGTQDVSAGGGQSQFQAWIEMLPQASHQVPLAVAPGDSVTVSIVEQSPGSGQWTISFKNNTSGQTYQTTVQYNSSQSSAEWIEEAPSSGNGIVPLDSFGTIPFSDATTVANGQTLDLSQAGAQPVTMVNPNGQALAVPSGIASNGAGFTVARTSVPATPAPSPANRRGSAG